MFFICADPPPMIPDPPPMISSLPEGSRGPKRVQLHGIWYDRFPDGTLEYCKECNKGKVPPFGTSVSIQEHNALIQAGARYITVPEVTAQPFRRISSNSQYDSDHQCNQCGASQYVVSGTTTNGHTHQCNHCGNSWWH